MSKKTKEKTAGGRTRIKKGDYVIVIAGAARFDRVVNEEEIDSGKTDEKERGKPQPRRVLAVYPKIDRILVESVAVAKRSYKKGSNPELPQGGIHDKGMPIHISNVMLVDPKEGTPTRIGMKTETKDGKTIRTRFAKKSGTVIND